MKLSFFLARRFFRPGKSQEKRKASTPAIRIATIGIAIGLAVMILSVSIVQGFQKEVSSRITGFVAHTEIIDINSFNSPESFPITTSPQMIDSIRRMPGIESVERFSTKIGILKTETDFQAISLKGVGSDYNVDFLKSQIVSGSMPVFNDSVSSNKILISQMIADALNLKVGDRVYAYFFEETVKMRRFEVAAIYRTNLKQFDKTFVLTDIHTVGKLNSWKDNQVSGLEIRTDNLDNLAASNQMLQNFLDKRIHATEPVYTALSVKENPRTAGIFSWLGLLNMNVWVILILVICVAGFSMVSSLLILILERTNTIGILKALGATNNRIRQTFLYYATLIIGRGLIIGNILAIALIQLQLHFGFVHLNPETYYVDKVPVELDWLAIVALNIATLIITVLALIIPSFIISKIQPAKAIRFE